MNPLAKSAIRELQIERGIALDPLGDLHHILKIAELADKVLDVSRDLRSEALLRPTLTVGNITMKRLSIGALEFLKESISDWFSDESDEAALSWAYCYAHVETPVEIWEHYATPRSWKKRLRKWAKTLDVTKAELVAAMDYFQKTESDLNDILDHIQVKGNDPEQLPPKESFGFLIDALCHEYGSDDPKYSKGEYWIWKCPAEEVELFVEAYLARKAQAAASKRSSTRMVVRDPDSRHSRTHRALREYIEIITQEKTDRGATAKGALEADYLGGAE